MAVVYAVPISGVNPDDNMCRARISRGRLEMLDRRRGQARIQGFAATLLLEYAVRKHFPYVVHPLSISTAEDGKPYLVSEPNIQFSLSHSGAWAVCALSDCHVGVDIEKREPGRRDIASRFFHRDEVRYINSLSSGSRDAAFYSLWTLKESFVKTTGRGLDLPLRSFCIDIRNKKPQIRYSEVEGDYSLFLLPFPDRDYQLSLCIEKANADEPAVIILDE